MKQIYSVELFSKYRSELMGIGIIGVLVAHSIGLGEIATPSNLYMKIIAFIPRLAFTQGFLFLSGFGLYYSFAKNGNIREFYVRRINRLLIPFIVLSVCFFIYKDFIETFKPMNFFLHISSLAFWFDGNYCGMWYIAISVFLYAIFPLFYKYILTTKRATMLILVVVFLILAFQQFVPAYYDKVSIGINKIPIFIIGVYAGRLSLYGKNKEWCILLCIVIVFWIITFFLKSHWVYAIEIYGMTEKIVYMFIICILFSVLKNWTPVKLIRNMLRWFGKYSLELYVLHLLIFCFLSSELLFGDITSITKVSIMIIGALCLCVPFHKLTGVIVKKINLK